MNVHSADRAWVALGSNLRQPERQLRQAARELASLPQTTLERLSSLYRSPALSGNEQPDYCNAVALLRTGLGPVALLRQLHGIEAAHGRRREAGQPHWASRTLDCDLLLHEQATTEDGLNLPHPGLLQRAFVLQPLAEISPELDLPDRQATAAVAAALDPLPYWSD